jgi:serine/threonine-protein kinase
MQTFLYSLFRIANSHYTGKPAATVPEFLDLGVQLLPQYIQNPADQRLAKLSLAESMFENGALDDAQRVFDEGIASAAAAYDRQSEAEAAAYSGNIAYQKGDTVKGASLTAHALDLARKGGVSTDVLVRAEDYFAVNRENLGFRTDENLQLLQDAAKRARAAALPPHQTADVLYSLASDLELRGRLDEAEPIYNESLATYGQDPSELCSRSNVQGDLAYLYEMRGDVQRALPGYKQAYDGFVACSGPNGQDALVEQDAYAGALIKLGRAQEAVPLLEKALPEWRKIVGDSQEISEVLYYLAAAYDDTGRYLDAEKTANELIQLQTGKVEPGDRRFGASHMVLARALAGQARYQEALGQARLADQVLSKNPGVSPGAKAMDAQAHTLLLDLQSKTAR